MNRKPIVVGIGELLWDILPTGKQVGGAPCNFVFHAMQAGCESLLISAVGNDNLGDELLTSLKELKIKTDFIQRNSFQTGKVTVRLNNDGHPDYTIHENTAWDNIIFNSEIEGKIPDIDAVCFGSLGQRNVVSAATIERLLKLVKPGCLKVFDINLRQQFYSHEIISQSLDSADILKLNDEELPVLSKFYNLTGDVKIQLNQLLKKFSLKYIVYTLGKSGSIIISENENSFCESPRVNVKDTVGAGDSFTAVVISGLLIKIGLKEIHKMATKTAAFVCTQKGACPVLPFSVF